jgi:hypothetical protein
LIRRCIGRFGPDQVFPGCIDSLLCRLCSSGKLICAALRCNPFGLSRRSSGFGGIYPVSHLLGVRKDTAWQGREPIVFIGRFLFASPQVGDTARQVDDAHPPIRPFSFDRRQARHAGLRGSDESIEGAGCGDVALPGCTDRTPRFVSALL